MSKNGVSVAGMGCLILSNWICNSDCGVSSLANILRFSFLEDDS